MGVIAFFKITNEKKRIKIGILELISSAFVAVVYCNPIYNSVLKQAIPKKESSSRIFRCALKVVLSFFTCKAKKGRTTIKTPPHLKNANSNGSMAPATKRPMTKFAD